MLQIAGSRLAAQAVHGGTKDAEKMAADIAGQGVSVKGAQRTVAQLLEAPQVRRKPTWAVYTRRDHATRAPVIAEDRIGQVSLSKLSVADVAYETAPAGRRKDHEALATLRGDRKRAAAGDEVPARDFVRRVSGGGGYLGRDVPGSAPRRRGSGRRPGCRRPGKAPEVDRFPADALARPASDQRTPRRLKGNPDRLPGRTTVAKEWI